MFLLLDLMVKFVFSSCFGFLVFRYLYIVGFYDIFKEFNCEVVAGNRLHMHKMYFLEFCYDVGNPFKGD